MSRPSFERLNYLLRPNKHIERKLVFECLAHFGAQHPLQTYRYLGFGSMWFADFIQAHRILKLDDMWSLELDDHVPRANFNRPYATIQVKNGHSSEILPRIPREEWVKPLVAWLDYDGYLNEDVVKDINLLLQQASPGSILIVTVNALRKVYKPKPPFVQGQTTSLEVVGRLLDPSVVEARFDAGKTAAGNQIDVEETRFGEFLASALLNYMQHRSLSIARTAGEQPLVFLPFANLCHVDGAEMVTVGGVLIAQDQGQAWRHPANSDLARDENGALPHVRLDLPPITVKEKLALDRCLPSSEADFLAGAAKTGVGLASSDLKTYRRHYMHFPVFAESIF